MGVEEQVLNSLKSSGMRMFSQAAYTTENLSVAFLKWCIEVKKRDDTKKELDDGGLVSLEKMLWAASHGQKLKTVSVADKDYENLLDILKKEDVTFSVMDLASDNTRAFFFLERDTEKVQASLDVLNAKVGILNEIKPNLFVSHIAENKIGMIDHVTDVELELFRHYIENENIIFSSMKETSGNNVLMFDVKDRDIVYETLAKGLWDLNNPFHGDEIREHIELKLHGRDAINIALEDAKREFYIVSGTHPENYIQVTEKDFKYYKNNNEIASKPRSLSLMDEVNMQIDSLENPLLLSASEFNKEPKERVTIIKEKMELFPARYDETVSQNTRESIKNLILQAANDRANVKFAEKVANMQMKISLDNEGNNPLFIDDDSISYTEFATYEHVWDVDEEEARKRDVKQYIETNQVLNSHDYIDIAVDEHSIDYIMHQAELRREQLQEERSQQRERNDKDR